MSELRRLGARVVVGLAVVVSACTGGDGSGPATSTRAPATTAVSGGVVFGSGSIPDGFPNDFPIPEAATIGSTLVDPNRDRYEVILLLPADQEAAIVFFEGNLVNAGYTITADGFEGDVWRIDFARDGEQGRMLIRREDTGFTSVAVDLTIG